MRRRAYIQDSQPEAEVLAEFGDAKSMKHLSGKVELRGGSSEDQRAAREWVENLCLRLRRPCRSLRIGVKNEPCFTSV